MRSPAIYEGYRPRPHWEPDVNTESVVLAVAFGLMTVIPAAELKLHSLDLSSREMSRDEWATAVVAGRKHHPFLIRNPLGYVVTSYEDSVALLRERRFHSAISFLAQMGGLTPEQQANFSGRRSILAMEGDEHSRVRRLVAPAFTPKAADRLRPYMREVVSGLVDAFVDTGRAEFVEAVCEPYPIPIICELLGAPKEDWKLFSQLATDLLRIFNGNLMADLPLISAARVGLDEYMTALIADRRKHPRADLISDLIAAEEQGDRLSSDELISLSEAVLVAGTDTTRNQLACAVAVFTQHTQQWALLAEQPELAPRAVEEAMRYLGTVRGSARFASTDIEYKGVLFPQGTFIFPNFVAGNTDERVWERPDEFDITKAAAGSAHLTFGSGIHYCLGAWLARAELQEALPLLARRLPNLHTDGEITWKPGSFGIWGPERLPIRFGSAGG